MDDNIALGLAPEIEERDPQDQRLGTARGLKQIAQRVQSDSAWFDYSRSAMSAGDLLGAREGLQHVLRLRPNPGPEVADALGRCLVRLAQYQAARDTFERALQLNPGYAPLYLGLSRAQVFLGQRKEAAATLTAAEKNLSTDNAAGWLSLIEEYEERGDLARALAALQRPGSQTEVNPGARLALGRVLFKMERFDEARLILESIPRKFSDRAERMAANRYLAALLNAPHYPHRDPALAEELWLELVQANPADTGSLLSLGQLYLEQGRNRPAAYVLMKLLETQPDSAQARMLLFHAFTRLGDAAAADEQRRIGQKLTHRDEQEAELQTSVSQAPTDYGKYLALAQFYVSSGLFSKALPELQTAVSLNSRSADAARALKQLYQRLGL